MFINHAKVNGLRKYSAVTSMLIFIAACVTQLSYLSTGVIAMTQKSSHDHPTAASISIAGIVIFSSISSTVFAGLIYYRRIKLIDIIKESGSLK
jgi:spore maturation protein SpmA